MDDKSGAEKKGNCYEITKALGRIFVRLSGALASAFKGLLRSDWLMDVAMELELDVPGGRWTG